MKNKYKIGSVKQFIDIQGLNEDELVERKQFNYDIQVLPEESRTIIATISTPDVDADGDIIIPKGADLSRFIKNPVIHADHSYLVEDVVGKATEIAITNNAIVTKIVFAETRKAEDTWQLVKNGFVKANSIGFIAKTILTKGTKKFNDYIKEQKMVVSDACKRIVSEFLLIESSIVSVPCNPSALNQAISSKSITLSDETKKKLGVEINPNGSESIDTEQVIEVDNSNEIVVDNTATIVLHDIESNIDSASEVELHDINNTDLLFKATDNVLVGNDGVVDGALEWKVDGVVGVTSFEDICYPTKYLKVIKPVVHVVPKEPAEKYVKVIRAGGPDIQKIARLKKLGKII